MGQELKTRGRSVIGPDGTVLTLANLPTPQTKRWVARRKAEVVVAVEGGLLSMDQACRMYGLTVEEFMAWEDSLHRFGLTGLCVSHTQDHNHRH